LFDCNDDSQLHTLIDCVFRSSAVETVSVDRKRTTVEIGFDRQSLTTASALRTFSEALSASAPPVEAHAVAAQAGNTASLLRPYLDRIPGRVNRIERRRGPEEGLALAASSAAAAAGRIVALVPSSISTESAVVVDVLIFEFDPIYQAALVNDAASNLLQAPPGHLSLRERILRQFRRMVYLAAAGGCFVMSIVGVITPGIPTVPFVLATGYFLARSSPALHERFKRSRFFGQMVRDYEDHGGLRWFTKLKLVLVTVGLIVISVIIAGATLPFLIVIGTMGCLGIYIITRIPTISRDSQSAAPTPALA
jgi:uncharacterized membrane protein YbaN (DUF454 family)